MSEGDVDAWTRGEVYLTLFREFDFFDPKDSPVLLAPFTAYAREARSILEERTDEEIKYACMLAEWAVNAPLEELIVEQFGANQPLLEEMTGHPDETMPRLLQRRQSVLELQGIPELKKARWQDLYASLTLAYVARATRFGDEASMEAAEAYQLSLSARQRSKGPANRNAAIKEKLFAFVEGKDDLSAARLARLFCEDHQEQSRDYIPTADTLQRWISAHRKRA